MMMIEEDDHLSKSPKSGVANTMRKCSKCAAVLVVVAIGLSIYLWGFGGMEALNSIFSQGNGLGATTNSTDSTSSPTSAPAAVTPNPTSSPVLDTDRPTSSPVSKSPTVSPTASPAPTNTPIASPTTATRSPSQEKATDRPTYFFERYFTRFPTVASTLSPTAATGAPSSSTIAPTDTPTLSTDAPTASPLSSTSAPSPETKSPTGSTEKPTVATDSPTTQSPTDSTSAPTATDVDTLDYVRVVFTADSSTSSTVREAFEEAAKRWSSILRSFSVEEDNVPANFRFNTDAGCSLSTDALVPSGPIKQLTIAAEIVPIDGAGRILGQAGFCGVFQLKSGTTTTFVPLIGQMTFDSADLASLEAAGTLKDVILHEMGHVIGIGTMWDVQFTINGNPFPTVLRDAIFQVVGGRLTSNPQNSPFYTGSNGKAAFSSLGGAGDVPVEDGSFRGLSAAQLQQGQGRGSVDSHWRETTFVNELMTPALNGGGVTNPLSQLSIRSLQDLRYDVDSSLADAYSIPSSRSSSPLARNTPVETVEMGSDVIMPSEETIQKGIDRVVRRARSMRRLTGRGLVSVFDFN